MRRVLIVASCLAVAGCASVGSTRAGSPAGVPAVTSGASLVPASPPVVASPPVAASSPVEVASRPPPPLPTPSPGSEGTLAPLPSGGRPTDPAAPGNVWDAQNVIDVFAAEVEATAQNEPGYCDLAVDAMHDGLTVWWHGTPPADIAAVLDRARAAHITPMVKVTAFDHRSLGLAEGKLTRLMPQLGISETAVSNDCSGLEVALVADRQSTETAVKAILGPSVPVQFKQMPFVSPL